MHPLEERIRNFDSSDFESLALDVFRFQYENVPDYREYCNYSGRTNPSTLEQIPFLPIRFFKSHQIIANNFEPEVLFKSSGTGGERSTHFVAFKDLYRHTFQKIYQNQIGNPNDQVILALLPNYLEQGESSLVFMVDQLIQNSQSKLSGFFLSEYDALIERYQQATSLGKQVVIFGVSYALLDLAMRNPDLSKATIIETGGMKGRRKEMTKAELHQSLKTGLNCENISSEYGMTELLSQGYSAKDGLFVPGHTMRILIREVNDPFHYIANGKTGGINIIDLANLYSCSFIETQDLGKLHENGFEIMGRFDHSDVRGCNLMVQ
ncbi:acyl transferase [Crocinitomicaceae bacterium]|nr:acyl transferase [Crocinitomicaceae bacterium]